MGDGGMAMVNVDLFETEHHPGPVVIVMAIYID
jgi:hypothetical protein